MSRRRLALSFYSPRSGFETSWKRPRKRKKETNGRWKSRSCKGKEVIHHVSIVKHEHKREEQLVLNN